MAKIKCIAFDFGRVLANFDHRKTCGLLADYSPRTEEEIHRAIFGSDLEKKYDSGLLSTMEFFRAVRKSIGLERDFVGLDRFEHMWGDIFTDNPGIDELLDEIKPDLRKLVISNTNSGHWKFISSMPMMERFFPDDRQLILSFRERTRKPDPKLFRKALKRGACAPAEAIYIDDVELYVSTAAELGFNAIRYDSRIQPAADLKKMLAPFDVFEKKGDRL